LIFQETKDEWFNEISKLVLYRGQALKNQYWILVIPFFFSV